jgi:hypothetical protein
MARIFYSMLMSLDGYTEDERGHFGWGVPEDEQVHSYISDALMPSLGTYLVPSHKSIAGPDRGGDSW